MEMPLELVCLRWDTELLEIMSQRKHTNAFRNCVFALDTEMSEIMGQREHTRNASRNCVFALGHRNT